MVHLKIEYFGLVLYLSILLKMRKKRKSIFCDVSLKIGQKVIL